MTNISLSAAGVKADCALLTSLGAAGAKADCTLPTILSLESLEFLEILRLFKFEDIITMVSRIVGGATPPSVMALLLHYFPGAKRRGNSYYFGASKDDCG